MPYTGNNPGIQANTLAGWVPRRLPCGIVDANRGYPEDQEGRWLPGDRGERSDRGYDDRYRVPEPRHAGPGPDRAEPHPLDGRPVEPHPLDARSPMPTRDPATPPIGPRSGVELPPFSPSYPTEQPFVPEPAFAPQSMVTAPPGTFGGPPGGAGLTSTPPPGYGPPPVGPPPSAFPDELADQPTGQHHTQPIDRSALRRPGPPKPTIYRTRRAGIIGALAAVTVVAELLLIRVLLTGEFASTVIPSAVLGGIFAMTGIPMVAMGLYGLMTGPVAAAGPVSARAWLRTPLAYLPIGLILLIAAGLATG